MSDQNGFVDYYSILQVNSDCDIKIIEGAYRYLVKKYHPDHPETADISRFTAVVEAYNTLKFPSKRAGYDIIYRSQKIDGSPKPQNNIGLDDKTTLNDFEMQKNILFFLYKSKRENPRENGVLGFHIQEFFNCSDDNFDFHIWYLKSKGFVELTEQGTLAITVMGVDHVISLHQPKSSEKLLTAQSRNPED